MSLIRYRSPSLLDDFRREMNDIFGGRTDKSTSEMTENGWLPSVDIREEDKQFVVLADVPGLSNEDIDVFVDDNHRLIMKGQHKEESKESKENYLRIERRTGSFYRAFQLPDNVDSHSITAKMRDGVMEVVLPKVERTTGGRKIQIEG